MPPTPTPSFELRIEFSGLCLYLTDPDEAKVLIVMPDARLKTPMKAHADGQPAVPHVGFVRFDLAALDTGVKGTLRGETPEEPSYEVVHRFNREDLSIGGLDASSGVPILPDVPDFSELAPTLMPMAGLLDKIPPEGVLMRTMLVGGRVESVLSGVAWRFERSLQPGNTPIAARQYATVVRWRSTLPGTGLPLRIARFDGKRTVEIPLRAIQYAGEPLPVVALRISNLCADNPLEWEELPLREAADEDDDFRWMYRPMQSVATTNPGTLFGGGMPVPKAKFDTSERAGDNCFGARATLRFPDAFNL